MELHEAHGEAVSIRIIFAVVSHTLLDQFIRPWLDGEVSYPLCGIAERRNRNTWRLCRRRGSCWCRSICGSLTLAGSSRSSVRTPLTLAGSGSVCASLTLTTGSAASSASSSGRPDPGEIRLAVGGPRRWRCQIGFTSRVFWDIARRSRFPLCQSGIGQGCDGSQKDCRVQQHFHLRPPMSMNSAVIV
jgi:hypothetical protein